VNGRTKTRRTTIRMNKMYQIIVKLNPPHAPSTIPQSTEAPAFATSRGKKQIAEIATVIQNI